VAGKVAMDIGASTGGFTDCLLQQDAVKVFAVDVGYGQLVWKLQKDTRVVILDRKNARKLTPDDVGEPVDLVVIDVSFISLKLIFPPVLKIIRPEGDIVALVKPQFEVGKDEVENKGVIKDPEKHLKVLFDLKEFVRNQGWMIHHLTTSPITGQKGNKEFLIHCVRKQPAGEISEDLIREEILQESQSQ
jgi:23S rRNA (cytidine1920-2'-O)/16S rRNA (cytidine1409-2'-O)-methyltransferase